MARKGNPISLRLSLNRSSDSSWFSDFNYGKLMYQDVNLGSYFGSRRPPTRLTFGLRLGRLITLHFPKRKFISFFFPRLPRRLKRREKSRPEKGCWEFKKVGPIGCLHSSDGTEKERKAVIGRGAGKRVEVESIRLDDREKQNEIRIWTIKKQGYGYHDRSPSIKKNLSKLFRVRRAFKHPKNAGVLNYIALLIKKKKKNDSFRKTKLFHLFVPFQYRSNSLTSHLLKRTLPAVRPSFNYLVMQYLLNTKNKMNFDPVVVLNHFVAPGVAEPSTMGGVNAQGISCLYKRICFLMAFLFLLVKILVEIESSTSDKKSLAEAKKRLSHFIRQAHSLRFAVTTKSTISFFPFFSATFFFLSDEVEVNVNKIKILFFIFVDHARKKCLGQLRRQFWKLIRKEKVLEKFIDLGGIGELKKAIHMMIEIIVKNRRITYGYNPYLMNEEKKMQSLLSNRTKTSTFIKSVKIKYVYQSASLIAQEISFQLKKKKRAFRSIFSQIVKDIKFLMKKGVEGIRICCSGRLEGAEIARTECGKYGKTSCNVFNQKMDYASAEVSTRYGILGLKVYISYRKRNKKKDGL